MNQPKQKKRNILRKILKIFGWIVGSIILLFILVAILIQVPAVQNFGKKKIVSFLEGKIGTKVRIDHLAITFPKMIVLEGVYFEDQQKDTLLFGNKLKVDISLFKLLKNKVELNEIDLDGITAHINRNAKGEFNFDYIIKAFASEDKNPDTTASTMKFSIEEIILDKINLKYKDDLIGYDVAFALHHFDTDIKTFDLDNLKFKIPLINLDGINAVVRQYQPLGDKIPQLDTVSSVAKTPAKPLNLQLGEINLSAIKFDYKNDIDSMFALLDLGRLNVEPNSIDITGQKITLNDLQLNNTTANIHLGRKQAAQVVAEKITNAADSAALTVKEQGWVFAVKNISLENNNFKFDNDASPALSKGIDYSHLDLKDLKLQAKSVYFQPDSILGEITDFAVKDKSGVQINKLETGFLYASSKAYLKDLDLETPDTRLRKSIEIEYPSIESLSKNINGMQMDVNLTGSQIGFKDVLYFVPSLASQPLFAKNPNGKLATDIILTGTVNNLQIQKLELRGLRATHVNIKGVVKGLPDMDKTYADLTINDISSSDGDIYSLVPKNSLPSNIAIPARVALHGSFKGSMQQLQTDLNVRTSFGNAIVKAIASNLKDSLRAEYTAGVTLDNFNIGKLLKQEQQFGLVSLRAKVEGYGYTPDNINASVRGVVSSAQVKGYTYQNFTFQGGGSKGKYNLTADIKDPNITLNLVADADLSGAKPAINAEIMVDSIALQPLNLSGDDIRIHTKVSAHIPVLDMDHLQGNILLTEMLVNTGEKRFTTDTIRVDATSTDSTNSIALSSPLAYASLSGKYTFSGIGSAAQQIINRYYKIANTPSLDTIPPQYADFHVKVYNSAFLREVMPTLELSDSLTLNGHLNSADNSIVIKGNIPNMTYGTTQIGKGTLDIQTTDSALNYAVVLKNLSSPSLYIPNAALTGNLKNNNIAYNLSVQDEKQKEKYLIAGNVLQQNGNYIISLLENGLKLDYDNWTVDPQNKIVIDSAKGIQTTAFKLSKEGQSLTVQSKTANFDAPLDIAFSNFKIESITKIAEKDSLAMGGVINGTATISNLKSSPVFVADLTINQFNYKKDTVGDIVVKVNNKQANTYNADISIKGNGNSLMVNGNYYTADKGSFDLDVNLEKLNLATIESFTQGKLKNMSGLLQGQLKIKGTTEAPRIRGNLDFKKAAMNVSQLNSLFRLEDESIYFTDDGVHFNDFTILDSANNTAVLDGSLFTDDYRKYAFRLNLDADDFQVLNSTKKDNPLYYGRLFIDSKIRVRGDMDKPEINADLTVNDKTKLTIVLPQNDPELAARNGIVEFFDQDFPQLDSMLLGPYDSLNHSTLKGLDVVANIEVDKMAQFNLIVDEANGDFVNVRGEASLSGGIDPSGKVSLTGEYNMKEGAYEMSVSLLKRRFEIKEGSTITWTGEPTTATVDITAIYKTKAAPIDLVEQQLSGVTDEVRNTYRQKLPFEVHLMMTGELLKPQIAFDIVLPEGNYNISTDVVNTSTAKLAQIKQDESEMNKQVFALLLLNRFVGENPFSSGSSTSNSTLVKQSVSKILADQLNNLAGNLVQGVDLNFGLESTDDYTTGKQASRTDLNVGVSKQLLNDRLKVSVGSSFELEGPAQSNQKSTNIAGDIQIDYKLSKDGRYTLRGYRKDQYEVALQGQVVETGLTFIISLDYDKLNELLKKSQDKKTTKREKKEAKKEEETNK